MRLDLELMKGAIDVHVHSAPDLFPRVCDDIDLARQAQQAGMKALVLKNHFSMTPFRAAIAKKVTGGTLDVFGGVVLNHSVGGFNPHIVGIHTIFPPALRAISTI